MKRKVLTINEPSSRPVPGLPLPNSSEAMTIAPTCLYGKEDKQFKRRCLPCPGCAEPADGSHQCGACFAHVHVFCGTPYDNAPEGYGQLLLCQDCGSAATPNGTTQPYDHAQISQTPREEGQVHDSLALDGGEAERGALAGYLKAALVTASKAASAGPGTSLEYKQQDRTKVHNLRVLLKKIKKARAQHKLGALARLSREYDNLMNTNGIPKTQETLCAKTTRKRHANTSEAQPTSQGLKKRAGPRIKKLKTASTRTPYGTKP
jgi:hypothetical protein